MAEEFHYDNYHRCAVLSRFVEFPTYSRLHGGILDYAIDGMVEQFREMASATSPDEFKWTCAVRSPGKSKRNAGKLAVDIRFNQKTYFGVIYYERDAEEIGKVLEAVQALWVAPLDIEAIIEKVLHFSES